MGKQDTQAQWDQLMMYVDTHIKSPRKEALTIMLEKLSEKILTAPASAHTTRHNCFPGGYIDHVNRVCKNVVALFSVWKELGANVSNYSLEEAVFSAICHDLGKIGSSSKDYYILNDSKWHVERGMIYKINPELQFMKVPDRSIFLLQEFGVSFSENEYLAIKLHDGLYSKGNESYLMSAQPEFSLKTDLPILLHHADHLSTLIESALQHTPEPTPAATKDPNRIKSKLTNINNPTVDASIKSAFDEIFG